VLEGSDELKFKKTVLELMDDDIVKVLGTAYDKKLIERDL
jgi:hypothetical protein